MVLIKTTSLLAAAATMLSMHPTTVTAHSEEDYEHMGPMGFMWPHDREWSEDDGMIAPCGTSGGAGNRTEFPLTNGALALEQKQQVYDVQIAIAFDQDPTNDTEFQVIFSSDQIQSLDFSHVCLDVPGLSSDASDGANATIQLQYTAEYIDPDHDHRKRHLPVNETFYACADVTLVQSEAFTFEIPCFNATAETDDEGDHDDDDHGHSHDDEEDDHDEAHDDDDDSHGHSSLSGGDIAGIVIGSVVGAAVLATVGWYLWRRDRREKQVAQQVLQAQEK